MLRLLGRTLPIDAVLACDRPGDCLGCRLVKLFRNVFVFYKLHDFLVACARLRTICLVASQSDFLGLAEVCDVLYLKLLACVRSVLLLALK